MTDIDWHLWIGILIAAGASLYVERLWKGHSRATQDIPHRRTLYDFLQTNPRIFPALWFIACGLYLAIRYGGK